MEQIDHCDNPTLHDLIESGYNYCKSQNIKPKDTHRIDLEIIQKFYLLTFVNQPYKIKLYFSNHSILRNSLLVLLAVLSLNGNKR